MLHQLARRFPPASVTKSEQFQVACVMVALSAWGGSRPAETLDAVPLPAQSLPALEKRRSVFSLSAAAFLSPQVVEGMTIGLPMRVAKPSEAPPIAGRCQCRRVGCLQNLAQGCDDQTDHHFDPDPHLYRLLSPKRSIIRLILLPCQYAFVKMKMHCAHPSACLSWLGYVLIAYPTWLLSQVSS